MTEQDWQPFVQGFTQRFNQVLSKMEKFDDDFYNLRGKHEFVESQVKDLESEIENLKQVNKSIEEESS
jgi:archaellum component FlaC